MIKNLFAGIIALTLLYSCTSDDYYVDMVDVEGGVFMMGSNDDDADDDEKPEHSVEIKSFRIGRYEVTQKLWNKVMHNRNPSEFKGDNRPVECVSWYDVQLFIRRLNKITGHSYRLPTEAEWEYAAKGGNKSHGYKFSGGKPEKTAWFIENSDSTTHDVGQLKPNELGIYDMSGNVHEWCSDLYDSLSYQRSAPGPQNLSDAELRIYRGGSWGSSRPYLRTANRNKHMARLRHYCLGFRLAEDKD
ncbi:MAG: formylglycine-generating enzyme family protein [Coprobacter sp.]|nr:formylglycine-generating enzyme family protein [Coprobacter sp.]